MMSVMDGVRDTFAAMTAPEPAGWTRKKLYNHPGANLKPHKFRGRWMPHQGKQEIERRRRQRERLEAKRNIDVRQFVFAQWLVFDQSAAQAVTATAQEYLNGPMKALLDDDVTGITIIPERRLGMSLMTSEKPAVICQVQDSGNPVGKPVHWTSSGLQKTGVITHVVPAGKTPSEVGAKVKDAGGPRDHESFVVEASGKTYWPRASLLNF